MVYHPTISAIFESRKCDEYYFIVLHLSTCTMHLFVFLLFRLEDIFFINEQITHTVLH